MLKYAFILYQIVIAIAHVAIIANFIHFWNKL